ncbi:MAG: hypothetical protein LKK00_04375 [Intestinimonas sp.]|jgi:hypothetical protein|nr:hypothetical protein [Intestinimonas sp.]
MSAEPKVQFFLGSNSPGGFYSLFDGLIDPAEADRIYILKGGPGCGKSTLMRRVAAAAEARGHPVEYILCSGDPDSLDAIVLPKQRAALVDGTAPHVVEPHYPGVVETYVNLGDGYDRSGLQNVRAEIISCMAGFGTFRQRTRRCLSAVAELSEGMREMLVTQPVEDKIKKRAHGILKREIRKKKSEETGRVEQRFLSAVTYRGQVCLFGTVDRLCKRVYELTDSYGLAHIMLAQLLAGATATGYQVIACPSPMAPERLEHLIIPELSLAFVTSRPELPYEKHPYRRIRMDAMADRDTEKKNRGRLRFSRKVCAALMEEAVDSLAQSKVRQDDLEALYHPYMDFTCVERLADGMITELLS